jgi:hypothetical protein
MVRPFENKRSGSLKSLAERSRDRKTFAMWRGRFRLSETPARGRETSLLTIRVHQKMSLLLAAMGHFFHEMRTG